MKFRYLKSNIKCIDEAGWKCDSIQKHQVFCKVVCHPLSPFNKALFVYRTGSGKTRCILEALNQLTDLESTRIILTPNQRTIFKKTFVEYVSLRKCCLINSFKLHVVKLLLFEIVFYRLMFS